MLQSHFKGVEAVGQLQLVETDGQTRLAVLLHSKLAAQVTW